MGNHNEYLAEGSKGWTWLLKLMYFHLSVKFPCTVCNVSSFPQLAFQRLLTKQTNAAKTCSQVCPNSFWPLIYHFYWSLLFVSQVQSDVCSLHCHINKISIKQKWLFFIALKSLPYKNLNQTWGDSEIVMLIWTSHFVMVRVVW